MFVTVIYELKAAVRIAAKHPVTTLLAIVSIALGIGTSTGIFSVADSLLLRPLAITHPDGGDRRPYAGPAQRS